MFTPTRIGMRCPQICAKYYPTLASVCIRARSGVRVIHISICVSVCTGNIIANKYLLPVAGSINIKEKLPKNWKLSLRTMREVNFCILTVASPVTLKDCIEARL